MTCILSKDCQSPKTLTSSQVVTRSNSISTHLSPHETPPQALKSLFKSWKFHYSVFAKDILKYPEYNNFSGISLAQVRTALLRFYSVNHNSSPASAEEFQYNKIYSSRKIPGRRIYYALQSDTILAKRCLIPIFQKNNIVLILYFHALTFLGLLVAPALLPPYIQKELLSRLLHRDLSNPEHKTNLHPHYEILYPNEWRSFFSEDPSSVAFISKQRISEKNLDCKKALEKKLRWMTLGVQYDWSSKKYTDDKAPKFPSDISKLINDLFPKIEPQAAIVNIYSPGDTLGLHRDVSEEIDRELVSINFGCEAYFIISLHDKKTEDNVSEVLHLRSGDVLCMTKESRYAWHGVPIIIENSCPDYLENWPGEDFPMWEGWMKRKRINLNVRQVWEELKL